MIIKRRICKDVFKRQKRMKYFGDANEISNIGITTIGTEVFIDYINDPPKSKPIQRAPLTKFKSKCSLRAYKPNIDHIKHIDPDKITTSSASNGFIKSGYMPKHIKKLIDDDKNEDNISIMVKNFPTYLDMDTLKNIFRQHFKSYGDIQRITILRNKNNTIKDIAFIEYYYNKHALSVFENPKRLIIERQIVSIEKKKKIKKKFIY